MGNGIKPISLSLKQPPASLTSPDIPVTSAQARANRNIACRNMRAVGRNLLDHITRGPSRRDIQVSRSEYRGARIFNESIRNLYRVARDANFALKEANRAQNSLDHAQRNLGQQSEEFQQSMRRSHQALSELRRFIDKANSEARTFKAGLEKINGSLRTLINVRNNARTIAQSYEASGRVLNHAENVAAEAEGRVRGLRFAQAEAEYNARGARARPSTPMQTGARPPLSARPRLSPTSIGGFLGGAATLLSFICVPLMAIHAAEMKRELDELIQQQREYNTSRCGHPDCLII